MTSTGADTVIGRYVLDDLVAESAGSSMWHGADPVLGRPVGVRVLPEADARAAGLEEAACLASQVNERHLVRVLDVIREDGVVAVITEWVPGRSFTEFLTEPLAPLEAARVALEVARALQIAHTTGIAHGRIRPSSLLVTDVGDVRLRGLGVEAVLWGCSPVPDPVAADIAGVGALLYCGLTGRWPFGDADGIPGAPRVSGGRGAASVPPPGHVVPSVPGVLDDVVARTVPGVPARRGPGRGRGAPITTMGQLVTALTLAVDVVRGHPVSRAGTSSPLLRRALGTAAGVVVVAGIAIGGFSLLSDAPAPSSARPGAPAPVPTPSVISPSTPTSRTPVVLPIVIARDYDPLGSGGENPDQVAFATDDDATTAWTTVVYRDDYLSGGKEGVGLLLDLGAVRPISQVTVDLVGRGTDIDIRTATIASQDPGAFQPFGAGSVVGARDNATLRVPDPVDARYVLLWLKRLPELPNGSYQGGISSVEIRGGA